MDAVTEWQFGAYLIDAVTEWQFGAYLIDAVTEWQFGALPDGRRDWVTVWCLTWWTPWLSDSLVTW